jgi:hypothetical protein
MTFRGPRLTIIRLGDGVGGNRERPTKQVGRFSGG